MMPAEPMGNSNPFEKQSMAPLSYDVRVPLQQEKPGYKQSPYLR